MKNKAACGAVVALLTIVLSTLPACSKNGGTQKNLRKRADQKNLEQITENDIRAEIEFGKLLSAKILGKYGLYKNKEMTEYVNLVGKGLARYAGRPELEFKFSILDTESVNAYAAPGGYIFVTRGALKKMRNESDLAGVLAHEIGHVTQKHIVRELNIQAVDDSSVSSFAVLIKTMAGGGSIEVAFLELAEQAAALLFESGLKHEDEFDADRTGALLLAQVGYHPPALQEYLEIIKAGKEDSKTMKVYNKTHPSFDERLKRLTVLNEKNGLNTMPGKKLKERFERAVGSRQ